jgi:hypothetical protein
MPVGLYEADRAVLAAVAVGVGGLARDPAPRSKRPTNEREFSRAILKGRDLDDVDLERLSMDTDAGEEKDRLGTYDELLLNKLGG